MWVFMKLKLRSIYSADNTAAFLNNQNIHQVLLNNKVSLFIMKYAFICDWSFNINVQTLMCPNNLKPPHIQNGQRISASASPWIS